MTCRHLTLALLLLPAGCAEDVPVLEVSALATIPVELVVPVSTLPAAVTTYRWELVASPEPSDRATPPHGDAATSPFTPDVRGVYLVDRWLVSDLAERIDYHIVVTARGSAPEAVIHGESSVAVGTEATLDATGSVSPERRALTYAWRLAMRPLDSHLVLDATEGATQHVRPDTVGEYHIELAVFDGELWSPMPATYVVYGQ